MIYHNAILKEISISFKNDIEIWEKFCGTISELNKEELNITEYSNLYYRIGMLYLESNKASDAIVYFLKAWDLLKELDVHYHWECYKLLVNVSSILDILYAKQGQRGLSLAFFKKYIHYNFTNPLIIGYGINCFSFRAINEYSLNDLANNQVTVVSPRLFNDPFDPLLYPWLSYVKGEVDYDLTPFEEACDGLKMRCFVSNYGLPKIHDTSRKICKKLKEYRNYLMWSHYADSHKGICIEYYFDNDFTTINQVENGLNEWIEIRYVGQGSITHNGMFSNAIGVKHNKWAYENEIRLIHYDPNNEDKYKYLKLSPNSKIHSVYFGINCPEKDIQSICEILNGQNIKFYKMRINPTNVYILKEELILF